MDVPSDDQEIVVISPAAIQALAELQKQRERNEEAAQKFADALNAAIPGLREVMDKIVDMAAAVYEVIRGAFDSLADALERVQEIADEILDDDGDQTRKRWKAAQRRFSQVEIVRYRQFERERANRCARTGGNFKIGGSGRRTGPKKAKKHKVRKRRWTVCSRKTKRRKK